MTINRYAKALAAAAVAGGAAFSSAGGSTVHEVIVGLVAAIVTGVVTWGVPNAEAAEVKTIGVAVDGALGAQTQVLPQVSAEAAK